MLATVMIMMKARVHCYGIVEWKLSEPVQALASRIIMAPRATTA